MKKVLLLLLGCMTTAMSWAVKADPTPALIKQADGTELMVMTYGDENMHWSVTSDGVLLSHVGYNYYIAKVNENGELIATTQLAHEKALRTAKENSLIAQQDKTRFKEAVKRTNQKRFISIGTTTPAYFPHVGSPKAVVILVDFSDMDFSLTDPVASFNDYLNAEGTGAMQNRGNREDRNYGSVRQYFSDMSGGQFTPQFDLYGPYKLSKQSAYYGEGEKDKTSRIQEMIQEACSLADEEINYADYDSNNDGYVDLVYIIYAGYSESMTQNSSDCIWPKSGTTNGGTFDEKKVSRYGINNEINYWPGYPTTEPTKRINGVGLFCHEFSHTMGLSDHYTNNYNEDNVAPEYWDLMDGGEYVDNGYTPTPYTPWEKDVMGWTTIETLTEAGKVTLQADEARKIVQDGTDQYLIVHNVRGSHLNADNTTTNGEGWARKQLGHGMLVYRIDYKRSQVSLGDYPNYNSKPGILIVPADGLIINSYRVTASEPTTSKPWTQTEYRLNHFGDPYPGTENVTEIQSVQMNSVKVGEEEVPVTIEKPILNITEDTQAGTITFDYLEVIADGIDAIKTVQPTTNGNIYTLDGRLVKNSNLTKGVYIKDGKKVVLK